MCVETDDGGCLGSPPKSSYAGGGGSQIPKPRIGYKGFCASSEAEAKGHWVQGSILGTARRGGEEEWGRGGGQVCPFCLLRLGSFCWKAPVRSQPAGEEGHRYHFSGERPPEMEVKQGLSGDTSGRGISGWGRGPPGQASEPAGPTGTSSGLSLDGQAWDTEPSLRAQGGGMAPPDRPRAGTPGLSLSSPLGPRCGRTVGPGPQGPV